MESGSSKVTKISSRGNTSSWDYAISRAERGFRQYFRPISEFSRSNSASSLDEIDTHTRENRSVCDHYSYNFQSEDEYDFRPPSRDVFSSVNRVINRQIDNFQHDVEGGAEDSVGENYRENDDLDLETHDYEYHDQNDAYRNTTYEDYSTTSFQPAFQNSLGPIAELVQRQIDRMRQSHSRDLERIAEETIKQDSSFQSESDFEQIAHAKEVQSIDERDESGSRAHHLHDLHGRHTVSSPRFFHGINTDPRGGLMLRNYDVLIYML